MALTNTQPDPIAEIFEGPVGTNKHRPRFVFEVPGHIVMMIKRNNTLLEKMQKHVEFGLKSPWLPSKPAAEYLGVSVSHLLHNLKDEITYSRSKKGKCNIIVFHVDDLDKYWMDRKVN